MALAQIRDLNSGSFGFVQLAKDKVTGKKVAIKFIDRGDRVSRSFSPQRCLKRREHRSRPSLAGRIFL